MKRDYTENADPDAILDRRFASGEIDEAEYTKLRGVLQSRTSPRPRRLSRDAGGSGFAIVAAVSIVLVVAVTAMALAYGPWGTMRGGMWPGGSCCSGGGMHGGTVDPGTSGVAIVNYAYSPEEITVQAGATITWTNGDRVMHTVSFGEHGGNHSDTPMDSGPMYQMDNWSYTFEEPGVYAYYCEPHPYMTGKVIVEG